MIDREEERKAQMNKIGWKDRKKDIQKGVLHTETNEEKSK